MAFTGHLLLLAVGIVASATARDIAFKDCGSPGGKVLTVDLTPCGANSGPCHVHKGSTLTATTNFKLGAHGTDKLLAKTYAIIHGFKVLYNTADVCEELQNNAHCPMSANTKYMAKGTQVIKKVPPFVHTINLETHFVNEHKKTLMCTRWQLIIDRHTAAANIVDFLFN